MKKWISFASVGLLILTGLPVALAQADRYPTEAELQQLLQELRENIPELEATGIYTDRRTPAEREARDAYADAWAEVDTAIAPYLGEWTAIEESLYLYPAANEGEVCILDIHLDLGDFYMGEVRDGKVYTTINHVLVLDSDFLGSTTVYEGQPSIYPYANPRLLPESFEQLEQYYPEMMTAFYEADCLTGLPDTAGESR